MFGDMLDATQCQAPYLPSSPTPVVFLVVHFSDGTRGPRRPCSPSSLAARCLSSAATEGPPSRPCSSFPPPTARRGCWCATGMIRRWLGRRGVRCVRRGAARPLRSDGAARAGELTRTAAGPGLTGSVLSRRPRGSIGGSGGGPLPRGGRVPRCLCGPARLSRARSLPPPGSLWPAVFLFRRSNPPWNMNTYAHRGTQAPRTGTDSHSPLPRPQHTDTQATAHRHA